MNITFDDLTIVWGDGTIPPVPSKELLARFHNVRVSTTFVTEEDLYGNRLLILERVKFFLKDYAMDPTRLHVVVMIARNPTTKWGHGFPFQIRISVFPHCPETVRLKRIYFAPSWERAQSPF